MISMTATEAARSFSRVLDLAAQGETILVTRGGELVASIVPPHRPNGSGIIDAYDAVEPDADFAADYERDRTWFNTPTQARDPWEDA
jgi:antitoxin (DNA-binding transcriptional repressor) of toxin-antitoxin stability system